MRGELLSRNREERGRRGRHFLEIGKKEEEGGDTF